VSKNIKFDLRVRQEVKNNNPDLPQKNVKTLMNSSVSNGQNSTLKTNVTRSTLSRIPLALFKHPELVSQVAQKMQLELKMEIEA
jgi:hypothetical protein